MIFDALMESAERGELLLIDGGYCRWHLRKDRTITIYEIISTRPGAGQEMIAALLATARSHHATAIVAKCPAKLPSNAWYVRRGFVHIRTETARSGNDLNVWQLDIQN